MTAVQSVEPAHATLTLVSEKTQNLWIGLVWDKLRCVRSFLQPTGTLGSD